MDPTPLSTTNPYPQLTFKPTSGLSFPWTFYNPNVVSSSDAAFGPDGVVFAEQMFVFDADLGTALQQLLGYSYRDTANGTPGALRRKLPWQHPFCNQMVVKNISSAKGISQSGKESTTPFADGSFGPGYTRNTGPWNTYKLWLLTLHFWRPPYYIRSDQDVQIPNPYPLAVNPNFPANMIQAEWKRYVSKDWEINVQMLTREGTSFVWAAGTGPTTGNSFQGAVGQPVTHQKVTRVWYEVPEEALFLATDDQCLNGLPTNFVYTQTQTTNPITGWVQPVGFPIGGCINVPIGGGTLAANPPYTTDNDATKRMFGCHMGTLRLDGVAIKPRPLQMPAELMQIANFSNGEPISQQQYDVHFTFDLFIPTPGDGVDSAYAGHNLMPWSGNGRWFPVRSQLDEHGLRVPPGNGKFMTPFQYADFSDLFVIL